VAFKDADEVRHYIGSVFTNAFADPEIGPKLKATGIVLGFNFTEPDATLVVDTTTETVGDGTGQPDTGTVATIDDRNWELQPSVEQNLPLSMARGKIKVDGNIASLLKLAPLSKKLFPAYVETLNAAGRADLIA